jgi:hypothetical protein
MKTLRVNTANITANTNANTANKSNNYCLTFFTCWQLWVIIGSDVGYYWLSV